ncbi:MAG: UDP-N-acetylmuramoyl-L-alanyl-D-glutamate--2,6-diaminopimelate ligase [Planctomycetota bacterium]
MRLDELIDRLDIRLVRGDAASLRVCDLTEDSRTVVPGSMFLARRGLLSDGRAYVADAVRAGATAVLAEDDGAFDPAGVPERAAVLLTRDPAAHAAHLAERFYANPSSKLGVMGVTGSNGKTTIAHLVHRAMNHRAPHHAGPHDRDDLEARRCGLIGTIEVDDGAELAPAEMTTPPAIEISRSLGLMADAGCAHAAMEVSSHALDQARVAAIRFRVGVFTNLTGEHADYHGSFEAYARAKARLFDALPTDGAAIVNADDPHHATMLERCDARVLRCSTAGDIGDRVDATARILSSSVDGMRVALAGPWGEAMVSPPLLGAHNAMNLLQAAAACWALGADRDQIESGLGAAGAPAGRLELVSAPGKDDVRAIVDYAHTDDALRRTLEAVRDTMSDGRLWVVFGAGGERDKAKRPRMGRAAADVAGRVVITSDNPRLEPPSDIVADILAGLELHERSDCVVHVDRDRAIAHAIESAEPGDVVVVAGKGHEREQIGADADGRLTHRPFDDRAVVREALARRRSVS